MTTPTTDRELLERAAKAAGLSIGYDSGQYFYCEHGPFGASMYGRRGNTALNWNPLQDDGDALRLAVKLGLFTVPEFFHFRSLERFAGQDSDEYTATRRAIVRAAAEIGKAMP